MTDEKTVTVQTNPRDFEFPIPYCSCFHCQSSDSVFPSSQEYTENKVTTWFYCFNCHELIYEITKRYYSNEGLEVQYGLFQEEDLNQVFKIVTEGDPVKEGLWKTGHQIPVFLNVGYHEYVEMFQEYRNNKNETFILFSELESHI
jgi:hypothetical protein